MSLDKQIISIIAFFVFGIFLYLNYNYFTKKKIVKTYLSTIILTCIFMFILYHLTNGFVHPYFIIVFILGILFSKICVKHIKIRVLKLKKHILK